VVTVYREAGWKIAVYGREHGVPHFHIEGPEFRCSVSIATLKSIIGTAPASVMKAACEWAQVNRTLLERTWHELNG
jgi:hypothetical protein